MITEMKKTARVRSAIIVPALLIAAMLISACDSPQPRLPTVYTYNPGAAFTINVAHDNPRSVLRCAVVFEVLDASAAEEMVNYNFMIRNAVLVVMGSLTMEELTTEKNIPEIAQRMVDLVNEALGGNVPLVVGAYFTEFIFS